MSSKVLHIGVETAPADLVARLPGITFVHVNHSQYDDEGGLIQVARKNPGVRGLLVELVNNGFNLYKTADRVSSFVHHNTLSTLWQPVVKGEIREFNGAYFSISPPPSLKPTKLLVVFSSVHENMYTPSLMRCFYPNFQSIQKYLPADAAVLRIADIGGVLGAFYMNTSFHTSNEDRIQQLLKHVILEIGVSEENVVLYGTSKGGTGALLHGVLGGYKVVAIDPIVSDDHYHNKYDDLHFTKGTFLEKKSERFTRLLSDSDLTKRPITVICSQRSPQFPFIRDIVHASKLGQKFYYFDSNNPAITDHAEVGPNTVNIAVMLMNMGLYGLEPAGERWKQVV